MEEKSFSLKFNPLLNVKCVKEYEDEISALKAENFELKTQLTHSNVPKVLYENKQEMDALLNQKNELQDAYDNIKAAYENLLQEKKLLENKINQEIMANNDRYTLLEDENKRLTLRLERFNKEITESATLKNQLLSATNDLNAIQQMVQNLESENQQIKYSYEMEIKRLNDLVSQKNSEIGEYNKRLEILTQKERNSSFIIQDLKATLNSQDRSKNMIEDLRSQIEGLTESNQKLVNEISDKDKQFESIKSEHKVYYNGMEKFKAIITKKMNELSTSLVDLNEKFLRLKGFCFISDENSKLLNKLGVKYSNFSEIITFFRSKHNEMTKKLESYKKEASDAAFFASSNKNAIDKKTLAILQEFKAQFTEAKNELLICKKYLEKKASENKFLKIENAKLLSNLTKQGKFADLNIYTGLKA